MTADRGTDSTRPAGAVAGRVAGIDVATSCCGRVPASSPQVSIIKPKYGFALLPSSWSHGADTIGQRNTCTGGPAAGTPTVLPIASMAPDTCLNPLRSSLIDW